MSFILQQVAAGYCPPGLAPGAKSQFVDGCRAINTGVGNFTLDGFGSIPDEERVVTLTPGPGTNVLGNTISFGMSAAGSGVLSFAILLNTAPFDAGFYFKLERRVSNR